MNILGIESSCDDTGIALIRNKEIIENIVLKQEHKKGVIPEYAARAHHVAIFESANKLINQHKIDLIAYTNGPGLIGSLFVGSSFAKGLAYALQCKIMPINHVEAHILLPFWLEKISFPSLCLMISGGHTMIVLVEEVGKYKILSESQDDAVGEVFDKVARYIGLDFPGGPEIELLAKKAVHKHSFKFPNVMQNSYDFSFSGLKTAAIQQIKIDDIANEEEILEIKADFCYQFQLHVAKLLSEKLLKMHKKFPCANWIVSGGVAANKTIISNLNEVALQNNACVFYPPINLCQDNGVMIAAAADLKYSKTEEYNNFNLKPLSSWKIV